MLKNNKVNLVIALVAAICLWAYVLGDDNSSYSDTIRNIPINYINAQALADSGLVVLENPTETVNITYTSQRTVKNKVTEKDFKITADLEGLKEGENTVKLTVEKPENVEVKSISSQKVKVVVDRLTEEEKPVNVVITNQTSDDSEPYIVQVSNDKVKVKGAETLVKSVVALNATLDASKVGNSLKSLSLELVPVDSRGNKVENLTPEYDNISVTTIMHNKKTVRLNVPVTGNQSTYIDRDISLPKTITIKGTDENLSRVDSISCKPVDISDIFEDTTIDLEPLLPEGIEVATDSQHLQAKITVTGVATKTFDFTENDIVRTGVDEDSVITLENVKVKVRISGKAEVVEQISEDDFRLYANVEGLTAGAHMVDLKCVCENKGLEIEYNPSEIKVIIE